MYVAAAVLRSYSYARSQLFSPRYISLNATKFLNHECVDISELRWYLEHTTANSGFDASTTRLSTIPAPVHIKIESAPLSVPPLSVDIKMRALNEDGREVFELLSDSELDAGEPDSDLEVIDALQRASRPSSMIPLTDANHITDNNFDSEEPDTGSGAALDSDDDASNLEESEMV
ncbi:hypothetical protein B0H11DRAFT_1932979 [Mycena galericulata]|nr:hypothetical protein B0H11DRAFT_1932979 [Mycena galericulata]